MAWVTIFVIIGMEGWVDIMYMVQDAYSFWVRHSKLCIGH